MLQEYTLKLTTDELKIVVGALHDMPYKAVAALLNKLQAQVIEQEAAANASKEIDAS